MSWLLALDFQLIVAAGIFALAMAAGAAPERLLGATLLGSAMLSSLCDRLQWAGWTQGTTWGHLIIDASVLIVILIVAIRANRLYPLWLGAAQLGRLVSQLWHLSLPHPLPRAHDLMETAVFDVQLATMIAGLAFHIHRRQQLGPSYPSWSA